MHRITLAAILFFATVTLSACSDDPTGPDETLSAAERTLLAESLFAFAFEATATDPPGAGPGPAPADFSFQIDLTAPCPVSGSVDISGALDGTVDEASGDLDFDYVLDQIHRGCVVRSEDGSVELRIDGEPATSLVYSLSASSGAFQAAGALTGGVRYTAGDRTGVCTADLSWSGSGAIDGGANFSLSGTICGADVSTTYDFT